MKEERIVRSREGSFNGDDCSSPSKILDNSAANQSAAASSTVTANMTCKVFLMTTNSRYQQYTMEASNKQVSFTQGRANTSPVRGAGIVDDLRRSRISSVDSPTKKLLCKNRRHFGLSIVTVNGHRKLYFLTYEQMLKAAEYLLAAQKFSNRIDQYKVI